jgi:multidrug efflux pump subunit AcrA (membrane-fusion protein)
MSAIGNPQLKPVEAPPQPGAPVGAPRSTPRRPWVALGAVLLVGVGGWLAWQKWLKPAPATSATPVAAVKTARVTVGPIEKAIRLAGQTSAQVFVNITAPILRGPDAGPMVLLVLAQSGKRVKQGELLAQLDMKASEDHIDDVVDQVAQVVSDINKRQAELAVDTEALQQTIRVAKSTLDKAILDERAGETRTEVEREILKLAVEEAQAAYKQSLADVEHYKVSQAADVRQLEINKIREDRHLGRHHSDLVKYTMKSPMDGMAVVQQVYRGGEWNLVQAGDQLLPGQLFMKVVRPDRMQVEATINQSDSDMFRIGQRCRIKLDAFPGVEFPGKIYSIGAMAIGTSRQQNYFVRTVPIKVSIEGAEERLIPDLSASVDVILAREANTAQVPLSAIHAEKGKEFVFVKKGDKFEKREVQTGLRSATHVAVVSGVREGEDVATERPRGS